MVAATKMTMTVAAAEGAKKETINNTKKIMLATAMREAQ